MAKAKIIQIEPVVITTYTDGNTTAYTVVMYALDKNGRIWRKAEYNSDWEEVPGPNVE